MSSFQEDTIQAVATTLDILQQISQNEQMLRKLIRGIGWDLDELVGFNLEDLSQALGPLAGDLEVLLTYLETPPNSFAGFKSALEHSRSALQRIEALKQALENVNFTGPDQDRLTDFTKDLINALLMIYLSNRYPLFYHIGLLLTFIDFDQDRLQPIRKANGQIIRYPAVWPKLHFNRILDLIQDPNTLLGDAYFPNGLQTDQDAFLAAHKLFPRLRNVLDIIGIPSTFGLDSAHGVDFGPESNRLVAGMMSIFPESGIEPLDFSLTLALSPASRGNLGLVIHPAGQLDFKQVIGDWFVQATLTAGIDAFAIGPEGPTFLAEAETSDVDLSILTGKLPDGAEAPTYVFGSNAGTRLEIGALTIGGDFQLDQSTYDAGILLDIASAAFVLMPGDGDGFIQKIIPEEGVQLDFNLALGWSRNQGFYFRGNAGLEAIYFINRSLFGVINLQSLRLSIQTHESKLKFIADIAFNLDIGPIKATVNRIGMAMSMEARDEGGNLGPFDLSLGFKTPEGIGFAIDAKAIRGAGALEFHPDKHEYIGVAELMVLEKFTLKAIAIITTRLPDNRPGYSFLLIITAEFNPVPLGFGFTLNGVGGLIGLHRSLDLDAIREGVGDDRFSYLLFPENPTQQLPQIVAGINSILPIREGRHSFGIMGFIGWGSPNLLQIKAGFLFEIPSWKFAIVGIAKAEIERRGKSLIRLQLNFAATFNPDEALFTFDGHLHESFLLAWPLEGDIAMRLRGGNEPYFLLSVGGFHPDFVPPSGLKLPPLKRLQVTIREGNPNIYANLYFAITSNTIQLGGKAQATYSKRGLSFDGYLGFDALIQFDPLYFVATIYGGVQVRAFGRTFLELALKGTVEGPYPLSFSLWVKVKIWRFTKTLRVPTVTIGSSRDTQLSEVDIWSILEPILRDDQNWTATPPPNRPIPVSTRSRETIENQLIFHPTDQIAVDQTRIPLKLRMERFGHQKPGEHQEFSIQLQTVNGESFPQHDILQFFSPGQFFDLSQEEQFRRPPFERYTSGLRVDDLAIIQAGEAVEKLADYESILIDPEEEQSQGLDPKIEKTDLFRHWISAGTLAGSAQGRLHQQQRAKRGQTVGLQQEQFAIVQTDRLQVFEGKTATSESEAQLQLKQLLVERPELGRHLEVVPLHTASLN